MDLTAGTARAGITHLPEIVVLVTVKDMILGQELLPDGGSLVVALQTLLGATFKYGCVEVLGVQFEDIDQILPCPAYCLFLEIVTERPVAQHLEHGVVVGVMSYLLQVVVLTAYAQAFLRVCHTAALGGAVAQNDILELVHSGVGEHKGGVILDHHGC